MTAGRTNDRITFQKRTEVDDGYGNPVSAPFTDQFTVWAELIADRGREVVAAGALVGIQTWTIRVRDFSQTQSVKVGWRAVNARDTSQVFNIRTNIALVKMRGWREMTADEGVAT